VFGSSEHLPYGECGEATARAIWARSDQGENTFRKSEAALDAPLPLRAPGAIRPLAKTKKGIL